MATALQHYQTLNPRGVATGSHKYSLTVARHATVVVAVPSTVHYPANLYIYKSECVCVCVCVCVCMFKINSLTP
jgi:hypothetical protein